MVLDTVAAAVFVNGTTAFRAQIIRLLPFMPMVWRRIAVERTAPREKGNAMLISCVADISPVTWRDGAALVAMPRRGAMFRPARGLRFATLWICT